MSGNGRFAAEPPSDPDVEHIDALWTRFKSTGDHDARAQLALHYQPLVTGVAYRVGVAVPPHVERSDLASYGLFGLFDAIDKFDPGRGFRFETYAIARIKGSIIDELRALDWVPRNVRAHARAMERAEAELQNRLRRCPSDDELVAELGVSRDELDRTRALINAGRPQFLQGRRDVAEDRNSPVVSMTVESDPYQDFDAKESLYCALQALSGREQIVLLAHYFDSMTLADIGARLGVTESRVCQIHTKALRRLRERIEREDQALVAR